VTNLLEIDLDGPASQSPHIIEVVCQFLRATDPDQESRFVEEATTGDYEHLLATAQRYGPALVFRKGDRPYNVETPDVEPLY
jgi:hypothetical protein